jgi:hypothetical protein
LDTHPLDRRRSASRYRAIQSGLSAIGQILPLAESPILTYRGP